MNYHSAVFLIKYRPRFQIQMILIEILINIEKLKDRPKPYRKLSDIISFHIRNAIIDEHAANFYKFRTSCLLYLAP